jgi:hypothetical protein
VRNSDLHYTRPPTISVTASCAKLLTRIDNLAGRWSYTKNEAVSKKKGGGGRAGAENDRGGDQAAGGARARGGALARMRARRQTGGGSDDDDDDQEDAINMKKVRKRGNLHRTARGADLRPR